MLCHSGIYLNSRSITVPCGQCMPCRINTGRKWTVRLLLEQLTNKHYSWFYTLTYDDSHVPRTPENVCTLQKHDFLKWLKAAARSLGGFRYYAIGEYGDDTMRPHYHLAVFPRTDFHPQRLLDQWTFGAVKSYRELEGKRARYLANYTSKKLTKDTDERLERDQEPEFRTSSMRPGLGAAYVPTIVRAYRTSGGKSVIEQRGDVERTIRIGGRIYPLPEFILKKVRAELGIPLLHGERLNIPNYETFHTTREAEWDPETARKQEVFLNAKTKRKRWRSPHPKI